MLTYSKAFRTEGDIIEGDVAPGSDALARLKLHVIPKEETRDASKPSIRQLTHYEQARPSLPRIIIGESRKNSIPKHSNDKFIIPKFISTF